MEANTGLKLLGLFRKEYSDIIGSDDINNNPSFPKWLSHVKNISGSEINELIADISRCVCFEHYTITQDNTIVPKCAEIPQQSDTSVCGRQCIFSLCELLTAKKLKLHADCNWYLYKKLSNEQKKSSKVVCPPILCCRTHYLTALKDEMAKQGKRELPRIFEKEMLSMWSLYPQFYTLSTKLDIINKMFFCEDADEDADADTNYTDCEDCENCEN